MRFGSVCWLTASPFGRSVAVAVSALCLLPASAAATSGTQLLTFDGYEEGTAISTQYEGQGIVFKDEDGYYPEIRWDEAAFTNPVLAGAFGFGSPISAEFVAPGTTTPATVENLSMDVGYIDEPGSTQLVVDHSDGNQSVLTADEYEFDHLFSGGSNISGFQLEATGEEPAGFELDNLEYTIPTPPPPPPPPPPSLPPVSAGPHCARFVVFDSRGSGEPNNVISHPGKEFIEGFRNRLKSLHVSGKVAPSSNAYPAVGVISFDPRVIANGFGALLHSATIGAYNDSEHEGEKALHLMISDHLRSPCAKSRIILLGYSQGAEVTGNVYQHLSGDQRKQIAAVVLWGDPLYNHNDKIADRDSRNLNGVRGTRKKFDEPGKVFSYCNTHDPVCQEPLPKLQLAHYLTKEHSLYWKSKPPQAENNGKAVGSFLAKK